MSQHIEPSLQDEKHTPLASKAKRVGMAFVEDGDIFPLHPGEQIKISMKLPDGVEDPISLWLPVEGSLSPTLKITRSFRTLKDGTYFTEHEFTGAEIGSTTVVFAAKNGPDIVHPDRINLTFVVSEN